MRAARPTRGCYDRVVPPKEEANWDRRRHVRVRPAADYDVRVEAVDGAVFSRVEVVDMSLGGLGILIEPPVDTFQLGAGIELRIGTPEAAEPVRAQAIVRHRARGVCGVEFQNLSEAAVNALRRAVSELLERGNQA
jgi:c-di-GMP-binding flagellar brake protein YcgR